MQVIHGCYCIINDIRADNYIGLCSKRIVKGPVSQKQGSLLYYIIKRQSIVVNSNFYELL